MTQSTLSIAIAAYRAAELACDDYERDVHEPGLLAFNAAIAAIPHHQTGATFINGDNERRSLSTASVGAVAVARRVLRDMKDGLVYGRQIEADNADYLAAVRELVIAADRREIEIEHLCSEHNVEAMEAHSTSLAREAGAARDAAFATPVSSVSDMRIKAELIAELECWDIAGEYLVADLQRISSGCVSDAAWRALVATYEQRKDEWEALNRASDQKERVFLDSRPAAPAKPTLAHPVTQGMTIAEISAIPLDRSQETFEAEVAEWERACEPLRAEIVGGSKAATDAAWQRYTETLREIEAYPSPSLAILSEKVKFLASEYACAEDHVLAIFADVRRLAAEASPAPEWDAALADYTAKKAVSDALPMDDEQASDAAVDAYCDAMDHLAMAVRAPDLDALAHKIQLAKDRRQYVGVPNGWLDGFLADVSQLKREGR